MQLGGEGRIHHQEDEKSTTYEHTDIVAKGFRLPVLSPYHVWSPMKILANAGGIISATGLISSFNIRPCSRLEQVFMDS